MKFIKININSIILFILACALSSIITAYATEKILSNEVEYRKNNVNNVKEALDDLYTKINPGIFKNLEFIEYKTQSVKPSQDVTETYENVEHGKYIILVARTLFTSGSTVVSSLYYKDISSITLTNGFAQKIDDTGMFYVEVKKTDNIIISSSKIGTGTSENTRFNTYLYKIKE